MTEPTTLQEALRLRDDYERQRSIKAEREMTELIAEKWPDSQVGREALEEVAGIEAGVDRRDQDQSPVEKALATKRRDRGFGQCSRPRCPWPAAEKNSLCTEHRAAERSVETKARKAT